VANRHARADAPQSIREQRAFFEEAMKLSKSTKKKDRFQGEEGR
jgi:hypothetical protein